MLHCGILKLVDYNPKKWIYHLYGAIPIGIVLGTIQNGLT